MAQVKVVILCFSSTKEPGGSRVFGATQAPGAFSRGGFFDRPIIYSTSVRVRLYSWVHKNKGFLAGAELGA